MATATIFGSTGLTGLALTNQLLEHPDFTKVLVALRKQLPMQHPKLQQVIIDYNHLETYTELFASQHIFCCLGTTIKKVNGNKEAFKQVDLHYPVRIAQQSIIHGCKSLHIISSLGAQSNSMFFYSRVKAEMQQTVTHLWQESDKQSAVYFYQPGLLLGDRKEKRTGENFGKILSRFTDPLLMGSLRKYRSVQAADVARAMLLTALTTTTGIHIISNTTIHNITHS